MYSLSQKLLSEFVGTFSVVLVAAGSVCADQYLRAAGLTGSGLLGQALAYGLAVAVMVGALGRVSGAHLNPAITVGFWVTKRLGTFQTISYCMAQLLGAITAAYVLMALLPESIWRPVALGSTDLAADFTRMQGMLLESLATFLLVFVYFASATEAGGSFRRYGGFAAGLGTTAGVLFAQPFTGASMNPARTFGPALAARHWINHGVYWVGPLFGGILAAVVYDRLFAQDRSPG